MNDPHGTGTLARALLHRAGTDPPSANSQLIVLQGPGAGSALPLGADETLGRGAAASLRLEDPALSRLHLRLRATGGQVWAEDLDSKNGTRVNGRRLGRRARAVLQGDVVTVGSTRLGILPSVPAALAGPTAPAPAPAPACRLFVAGAALALGLALALLAAG